MKPQRFHGNADGPECIIDTDDDGPPLVDCMGWVCERLYATIAEAEACCAEPGDVGPGHVVGP